MSGDAPAAFVNRLRAIAAAVDPTLRVTAYPLVEIEREANLGFRLMAIALSLVIVAVLLLSAAGIYALMSFTVSQRRKEIGIRVALGANARTLLASIFARAGGQLALGVAVRARDRAVSRPFERRHALREGSRCPAARDVGE